MAYVYPHLSPPPVIRSPALSYSASHEILFAKERYLDEEKDDPELYHGAFSTCICKKCMEDAKTEMEKHFSDESLTTCYIKRLEMLVHNLQVDNKRLKPVLNRFSRPGSPSSLGDIDSAEDILKDTDVPVLSADESKVKIKRMKKVCSRDGIETVQRDFEVEVIESRTNKLGSQNVLTVFRHFDQSHFDQSYDFWQRSVEIMSPVFLDVLRQVSNYDIDIVLVDDVLSLTEPFMLLFHHRKHLAKYLAQVDGNCVDIVPTQARAHTSLILDYMMSEFDGVNQTLDDLDSAEPSGLITFPEIWLLYPPGTVVYTTYNGEHEALIVDSVHGVTKRPRRSSGTQLHEKLELTCWSMNYDGEIFGRDWSTHIVAPFNGTKEIATLDLVPEQYYPDAEKVKEILIARGKDFWALQGQNYREYTGEIWSQHMNEEPIRVMVDHLTYQRKMNWPIRINRKSGPSVALSKDWRHNKYFAPQRPDFRYNEQIPCGPLMPSLPYMPPHGVKNFDSEHELLFGEPYRRSSCERPPFRRDSKFNKYDALEPDSQPDDLTLFLCPQNVYGYCLRDKFWSECFAQ